MKISNVAHKGLRQFLVANDPSRLPPAYVEKIRNVLSFLQEMSGPEELHSVPVWRAHRLAGDRKGTWSLTISRNWRITFAIDQVEREIVDLDFEDYH